MLLFGLVEVGRVDVEPYAHLRGCVELYRYRDGVVAAHNPEGYGPVGVTFERGEEDVERRGFDGINRYDSVPFLQTGLGSPFAGSHLRDFHRHTVSHEVDRAGLVLHLLVNLEDEVLGDFYGHCVATVADYLHLLGLEHHEASLAGMHQRLAVGGEGNVAVTEPGFLCRRGEGHTHLGFPEGDVFLASGPYDAGVDDDGKQEVEEHTGYHHEEALPCGVAAELPGLRRLGHLLLVHRLVYHARYFAVAAQRQPAQAVFGVVPESGFPLFLGGEVVAGSVGFFTLLLFLVFGVGDVLVLFAETGIALREPFE